MVMVSRILRLGAVPAARRFERLTRDPRAAQEAVLHRVLAMNATTTVGRRYGFRDIATIDDFRRRVPVRDYEAMRSDAESAVLGAKGVLSRETPYFYSLTSGTASAPKLIPVTPSFQRVGREATSTWLSHCLRKHPGFVDQKLLAVTSPAEEGRTGEGTPFGSASGRIYREAPLPLRRCYAVPYDVFEVESYHDRYALIALFALQARLSGMVTPNPLTLLRVLEAAEHNVEAILRSLHDGTIDQALNGNALRKYVRPNAARARSIARIAERRAPLLASDLWPDLSLVACWTGASVGAQLPRLRARIGPHVPVRDLGLVASEARLSIPVEDETPHGVLALANAFFEFVPEEEMGENPRTLLCHELVPGRRYRVLLTGWNGLYRYDINDVVEVSDYYNATPRIAFVRKGRDMANLTGEKVHVNQLLAAVEEAEEELGLSVQAFKVIANESELRYDFLIEPEPGPRGVAPRLAHELAAAADRALASQNLEYASKRRSLRLNAPSVSIQRAGWSDATLKRELDRGKRDVQYKWRHLEETEQALDVTYRLWSTDPVRAATLSRKLSASPAPLTRAG